MSPLLVQSGLAFPLKAANKGMIQQRYDPMSRQVNSVRSQLDAALPGVSREELLKLWTGSSVQVQLRSPV